MNARYPVRWLALGALGLSLFAVGMDMTVLNTALPTLAVDLHATSTQLQWFVDGYNLVLAAAVLPAGLFGDQLGQRRMLIAALVLDVTMDSVFSPRVALVRSIPCDLVASRCLLGHAAVSATCMSG